MQSTATWHAGRMQQSASHSKLKDLFGDSLSIAASGDIMLSSSSSVATTPAAALDLALAPIAEGASPTAEAAPEGAGAQTAAADAGATPAEDEG